MLPTVYHLYHNPPIIVPSCLRWTYTGHSKINVTTQFNPCDVVTTTAGHIIVCDFITHALHVLSEQGDILTCKVMEDTGIKYPLSLDIDMRGQCQVIKDI